MPEIRNNNNDSPAYDDWSKAKRLYEQALYEDCFYALLPGFVRDSDYTPLYALAAEVSGKLGAEGARELFSEVAHGRADAGVFDELGNMYFEGRQWRLAAMFLHKSLGLEPDNSGARYDLGLSYVHLHQLQDAVNVLEQDKTSDFWCKYLWYKVRIFQGNTHRLATDIAGFEALTHARHTQGDSEVEILKAAELREVLARYESVDCVRPHIRVWHFIQYGGVILDCGAGEDSSGRYTSVLATSEFVKAIADGLKALCDLLSLNIERIAALPDRDSEIIGRILAKNLNIEFGLYLDAELTKNAFIVASDSALFDDYHELGTAAFGNITFAAWQNWLSASYVCPDIVGIMAQSCVFPWNEGIQAIDTDGPLFGLLTPDDRSPEVIAQAILRTESQPTNFKPDFYAERKSLLKGIGAQSGRHRYNFMTESPVPGSWFGF